MKFPFQMNPQEMKKWMDEIIAEARYEAAKQILAKYYVGQLQGVKTMEQRIVKINQRGWDKVAKKPHFKTVDEVACEFQQVLQEVSEHTNQNKIPNLQRTYYQALSDELKKKLVVFLTPAPPATFNQNLARFQEFVVEARKAEQKLQTISSFASRAVERARNSRSPMPRGPASA
jgi:hypothetical protein